MISINVKPKTAQIGGIDFIMSDANQSDLIRLTPILKTLINHVDLNLATWSYDTSTEMLIATAIHDTLFVDPALILPILNCSWQAAEKAIANYNMVGLTNISLTNVELYTKDFEWESVFDIPGLTRLI